MWRGGGQKIIRIKNADFSDRTFRD